MPGWQKISSQTVYRSRIFNVREDKAIAPSGKKGTYYVVEAVGAATIVALDKQNQIYLLREEKYIPGLIWTIPAGKLIPGEEPLMTAKRELEEEAGLMAKKWTDLGRFLSSPGYSNGVGYCFLAQEISQTKQKLEPDEKIEVVKVPFSKALEMIKKGEIIDAWAIIPIFKAKLNLGI